MFNLRVIGLGLWLVVTSGMWGQSAQPLRQNRLDIAPSPSARFPAEWYIEGSQTFREAPVVGAPYRGTVVLSTNVTVPGHDPLISRIQTLMMRDAAGRTRDEQYGAEYVGMANPFAGSQSRQIEVYDVITHCRFRWVEPAADVAQQVAIVSCRRQMNYSPDEMEEKMALKKPELKTLNGESDLAEPLGEKTIAGLRALGIKHTRTLESSKGKNVSVGEKWWSPELKEMLEMRTAVNSQNIMTIEMKDVTRGEPDAALFYPPPGWKIVWQSDSP